MHRLCSLLGMPQRRFASIHVVGTNGKTSVALMAAALLEAQGVRSGSYTSPHIRDWRERIRIGGEPISEDAFVGALERAEQAAVAADRKAPEDEGPVTQFELVTAAAFVAFAEARVKIAVIEAGLGGRLDATNVIPSKLTVLTSVGLDHTEWLGDTLQEIAAEKLAVLRDHTPLVRGEVPEEVEPVIAREVATRHAPEVQPEAIMGGAGPPGDESLPAIRGYQQLNLALAWPAAQLALGRSDPPDLVEAVKALTGLRNPGRAQVIDGDPPQIFDAAHNPDGARALADLLPELLPLADRPQRRVRLFRRMRGKRLQSPSVAREIVCCLAVLAEKDARGIVEALAPACARFVCTEIPVEAIRGSGRPVGESHAAATLVELCREAGAEAEAIADPLEAWARAKELARERDAAALAAGSHYLLSCLWTERPVPSY